MLFDGSNQNFSQDIANKICARIAAGEYTHDACLAEGMQPSTVYGWRDYNANFAVAWQRAHEQKAQVLLKKAVESIADRPDDDIVYAGKDMNMCNGARVNRNKAQCDFYRWWATRCDKSLTDKDFELEALKKQVFELEHQLGKK